MTDTTFGYTIFCDDIRNEVGGKHSYIGIYNGELFIAGDFPTTLPKLGLAIHFKEPHYASTDPVTFKIFMPEDAEDAASIEGSLPIDEARKEAALLNPTKEPGKMISMQMHVVLSPLPLNGPGRIKIRAYRGGREFKLGTLRLSKAGAMGGAP